MKRRILSLLLPLAASSAFAAGPNVLSNTVHEIRQVRSVISNLGTLGSTGSVVDSTCSTSGKGWQGTADCGDSGSFVIPFAFAAYALGKPGSLLHGEPIRFWSGSTAVDSRPYKVITESSGGYSLDFDQMNYAALVRNDMVFNMAFCGDVKPNDYPPIAMTNVQLNGKGKLGVTGDICGYGQGIEFSMSAGYLGSKNSPSAVTATLAGILAVMRQKHPTWTWADIKGALRQTAGNWSTGWTPCAKCSADTLGSGFGYGDVNFVAADSIKSADAIYLQPPGLRVDFSSDAAVVRLFPFRQTRRTKEVVYMGGKWPSPKTGCGGKTCNEYTAAQIAAAGGQLIYASNGRDMTPTFIYKSAIPQSASFVALTLDGKGNGSRVESFMPLSGRLGDRATSAPAKPFAEENRSRE